MRSFRSQQHTVDLKRQDLPDLRGLLQSRDAAQGMEMDSVSHKRIGQRRFWSACGVNKARVFRCQVVQALESRIEVRACLC